eukprot:7145974-Prymnesium_polylepis.1
MGVARVDSIAPHARMAFAAAFSTSGAASSSRSHVICSVECTRSEAGTCSEHRGDGDARKKHARASVAVTCPCASGTPA